MGLVLRNLYCRRQMGPICQRWGKEALVVGLLGWWIGFYIKIAGEKEPQSFPFLPFWCWGQNEMLRYWRGFAGCQESTWRTAQSNSRHSASKATSLGLQIKWLCAKTHGIENKQEELQMGTCLQSYDLGGIMEMGWDSSYDWSAGMEECRILRMGRQGRWRGSCYDLV